MKKNKKIAILGATGHIGRNLVFHLSKENKYKLYLFSRNKDKLLKIFYTNKFNNTISIGTLKNFEKFKYDVIINCIGIGDPKEMAKSKLSILEISEYYDSKILKYLDKNKSALYINFSSGSVYGENFNVPVTDKSYSKLDINKPTNGLFYSVSKIFLESKHRALVNLNIVDLRVFGFFSRFIDLNSGFFISQIVSSIKNNRKLMTDDVDIVRDFVHPKDLCNMVEKCISQISINDAFDVYSKKPISKFEIIDIMSKKYGLKYSIQKDLDLISPTGIKKKYYSLSRKAEKMGYIPKYSSLGTIMCEAEAILDSTKKDKGVV